MEGESGEQVGGELESVTSSASGVTSPLKLLRNKIPSHPSPPIPPLPLEVGPLEVGLLKPARGPGGAL